MRIFHYEAQKVESNDRTATAASILYWALRGFSWLIAASLGLNILSAYIWVPFYAGEAYTIQFQDRILILVGDVLLFISIVIPNRWCLRWPGFLFRIAMIVCAILWIVLVDIIAYDRRLSTMPFTHHGFIALLVGVVLFVMLALQFERRRRTSAWRGLADE
jgi:hypothetical protein